MSQPLILAVALLALSALLPALHLAQAERSERTAAVLPLRDRLIGQILEAVPETRLTGHPGQRLPNHASFVFDNIDGNMLLMQLDLAGFACSSGSACKSGNPEPSGVLTSIGLPRHWALGSLRVTLGVHTTPSHIDALCAVLPMIIPKVRSG